VQDNQAEAKSQGREVRRARLERAWHRPQGRVTELFRLRATAMDLFQRRRGLAFERLRGAAPGKSRDNRDRIRACTRGSRTAAKLHAPDEVTP
jgi:hypothetical protein